MKTHKYVICIDNGDYPASLETRKIYVVLPDPKAAEIGQIRVIDESREDYLYPSSRFIEIQLPKDAQEAITRAA